MIDKIGLYLSDEKIKRDGWRILTLQPQVQNPSGHMLADTSGWTIVKGLYLAKGTENYIIIGNFKTREKSNYRETFVKDYYIPFKLNAYYYIDDVNVIPWTKNNTSVCTYEDFMQYDSMKPSYVVKINDTIILKNLLFDTDSYMQQPEVFKELFPLVIYMKSKPGVQIDLYGHTDDMGSEKYNVKLSLKRSQFVADFLINHGIEPRRVHYFGLGEEQPLADNSNDDGKKLNRRVEFRLYYP